MSRHIRTFVRLIPTFVFIVLFYNAVSLAQAGEVYVGLGYSFASLAPLTVMFFQADKLFTEK